MRLSELFLSERIRTLTTQEKALLKMDINDMSDEERQLRAKIDVDDWEENKQAMTSRHGSHNKVSDFESDANFQGIRKNKQYQIRKGMNVFVYRNLNVSAIDKRIHKDQIVWSLRSNENITGSGGYSDISKGNVIHHAVNVALSNVKFVVKEGTESKYGAHSEIEWSDTGEPIHTRNRRADTGTGWRGVRSSGQKNVHAGVSGDLLSWGSVAFPDFKEIMTNDEWSIITYDPYKFTDFQIVDKATLGPGKTMSTIGKVSGADMVLMGNMPAKILNVIQIQRPLVLAKNAK